MTRQKYLVGNWKMNQSLVEIDGFFADLDREQLKGGGHQFWIAPQSLHIAHCLPLARGMGIAIGAQNCSDFVQGAYTGEVSPQALREMGAAFTLVGHSERRALFREGHELLGRKVGMALSQGLAVIFCVGETLEQREAGQTLAVLEQQIVQALGLGEASKAGSQQLILAYEPVWAIGTGKTATTEMAGEAHAAIRKILSDKLGLEGEQFSILYGGSVKPDNARDLLGQQDIDGALVGGASLKSQDFSRLASILNSVDMAFHGQ